MSNEYKRSPFDIPADDECAVCNGRGYAAETAQRGEIRDRKYVTTELGYGCLTCAGTGRTEAHK
jgi:DnaJ-class molecular chaperone